MNTNEEDEEVTPVQSKGQYYESDPSEDINILADDDSYTENEVSE